MTFSIMYTWRVSRVGNPSAKNAIPAGREKKQNQKKRKKEGGNKTKQRQRYWLSRHERFQSEGGRGMVMKRALS